MTSLPYDEAADTDAPADASGRPGGGSPGANQGKSEPFPASPSQGDQETPGADHPQAPSPAADDGTAGSAGSVPVSGTQAAEGTSEGLPVAQPVHVPELDDTLER